MRRFFLHISEKKHYLFCDFYKTKHELLTNY